MDAKRTWSARVGAMVVASSLLLLAGCSGDDSALSVAQKSLTQKERALDDANAALTDASAAFCTSAATYITALDRYGDILTQTATTVGDVTTAGADLTEPGQDTQDAAAAVTSARDDVATAQQDVADAQAKVAAAEASATGGTAPEPVETPTPTTTPLVPPATVDRVQQAEADFETASAGITDRTPIVEASEQFNAAAVALETAWLQLFAQSGCLTDEQQAQAAVAVQGYTLALQQSLTDAGYYTGAIDGIYGPATVAAVVALQAANGLPQTGTVDKATEAALHAQLEAAGGAAASASIASTAALQQTLTLAGYWTGPVDGIWTDELTAAVASAQTDLGVPATGVVDAVTIAAFQKALADAQAEPTPSATDAG